MGSNVSVHHHSITCPMQLQRGRRHLFGTACSTCRIPWSSQDTCMYYWHCCGAVWNCGAEASSWLWTMVGIWKNFHYLAAHEISTLLEPEKSIALLMFHALTGCDMVSTCAVHGKITDWASWNALLALIDALLRLAWTQCNIPEEIMHTIERFIILLSNWMRL